jgi:putative phosphoribosyl transferase
MTATGGSVMAIEHDVRIAIDTVQLDGDLVLTPESRGLVIFAHGSGSGRTSPRNRQVAAALQQQHLATLLFDLLTLEEEAVDRRTTHLRFDIALLADRLIAATDWVTSHPRLGRLPLGYFGASTGAAAALVAAAERPSDVTAVVSRGGRPDLAARALAQVRAPTLLIVGGDDLAALELNQRARALMRAEVVLGVVPGASRLFEEPGALEEVVRLAGGWFAQHLARRPAA